MKVYVITIGWDYEGEAVVGVCSTLERAINEVETREKLSGDSLFIYEMPIDDIEDSAPFGYNSVAEWRIKRDWTEKTYKVVRVRIK